MKKMRLLIQSLIIVLFLSQTAFATAVSGITFSVTGEETFTEDNNVHTFTITKSGEAIGGSVDFEFSGKAIYGEDYNNIGGTAGATTTSGTVVFSAGETSKTITVTCIDDNLDEIDQGIRLVISNPVADGGGYASIGTDVARKMIIDNDDPPTVSFSFVGNPIPEDGGVGTLFVNLSCKSQRNIEVELKFDGTAQLAGVDYWRTSRFLYYNPGDTSETVTITAVADAVDDDNETIEIYVRNGTNVLYDKSVLVVTIDQNNPPFLSKIPDVTLQEDQQSSKIQFQIDDDDPIELIRVFGRAENKTLIPNDFAFYGEGKDRGFRITPAPDQTGQTRGWIMVYDGMNWTSKSFTITVTGQNDPPGPGAEPTPVVFTEDGADTLNLSQFVYDPDNDPSELRWKVRVQNNPPETESVKTQTLSSLSTIYQSYYVIFGEDAPVNSTLLDTSLSDNWVIVPDGSILPLTVTNDTILIHNLNDVNGLYVSIIRSSTETFFYGSPNFNDSEIPLIFTASDPSGSSYSFSMTVTIVPVNDAPIFREPLPSVEMTAGDQMMLSWGLLGYVEDVDNDDADLEFQVLSSEHVTVALQSDTLIFVAEEDWLGVENVRVIVSDGELSDTAFCAVTVVADAQSENTTAVNAIKSVPTEYALMDNYPNPFNPTTSISYSIPKQSHVHLAIYNIMGQCIEILVNEIKDPGNYTQEWNAGETSSGIYFYEIRAGEFHSLQRCILLK